VIIVAIYYANLAKLQRSIIFD